MSYFDDASLVMIPSGTKTSKVYSVKPIDGSGDLTFTRSNDTATRVNSAGLIEKVRTNVLTYSQDFSNANWVGFDVTRTGSQTDPNGGTTASLYTSQTNSGNVSANFSTASSSPYTLSIYIKGTTSGVVSLRVDSGSTAAQNNISYTTDWQRFTYTFTAGASTSTVVLGGYASFTTGEGIYVAFAQAELGDIATDYIATTTASVSVGPVANVPRLDYLNSSCPRLLLEGQRTNITLYSEQMNNAAWAATNCTVSANAVTSPDGYTNADNISTTAANSYFAPVAAVTISADASTYTQSIFVKWVSGSEVVKLRAALTGGTSVAKETIANIRTGVITSTDTTAQIVSYGNGWYRLSQQVTNNSTNTNFNYQFYPTNDGTNTNVISLWGAMAEVGSYATSYIPTLGSASTRGADAASKTGISSLIGQTEGTFFAEVTLLGNTGNFNVLNTNNVTTNAITLHIEGSQVRGYVYANSSLYNSIIGGSVSVGNTYKMAYAYKSGDAALYLNGVQIGTASQAFAFSASVDKIEVADPDTYFSYQEGIKFAQAILFPTRLTNAQLAELTTL